MISRLNPEVKLGDFLAAFPSTSNAVREFEIAFANQFEAVEAVAFPYGRSAQWAFLKAVGIQNADVCMPAYTCSVVAHAVSLSGNTPHFIDIELDTYNMQLERLAESVGPRTRAIIATHTFGYPQDIDILQSVADQASQRFGHKVWLIQDCAHAFGARWQGRLINSVGDVGVFGLNVSKLSTSIFGGMLTFQDDSLAAQVRDWRDTHFTAATWEKSIRRYLYLGAAVASFREPLLSASSLLQERTSFLRRWTHAYHRDGKIAFPPDFLDSMSELEARVGLRHLARYNARVEARQRAAANLDQDLLVPHEWVKPPVVIGATYSHYSMRVPNREQALKQWARQGVQLGRVIDYSIPQNAEYGSRNSLDFPNASLASKSVINIPFTQPQRSVSVARTLYA